MTQYRHVRRVVESVPTTEGAGVHLHRAIGLGKPEEYDPFLLLDDFRSDRPSDYIKGFPWHPHRGMETITYVLRGDVEHRDSLGTGGVSGEGDVQWMTAGSGIVHQEMPKGGAGGAMYGFQLWCNLPAANKMMDPRYRGITAGEIPVVNDSGGAMVKVIAGTVGNVKGPVQDVVSRPEYLDVSIPAGKTFTHPTTRGHTVFAYVFEGKGRFEPQGALIGNRHLVSFDDGEAVSVTAEAEPVGFILVSGKPIGEPIAWAGPIVMNTEEELRIAFAELDDGTFIKRKK